MEINLLWSGREYYSLEHCAVNTTESGADIDSVILGRYGKKIYRVEYQIKTNQHWETLFLEIKNQHDNQTEYLRFESDGKGNWETNDHNPSRFKGCMDVDIPLTPFTNTLPINRLNLREGEEREIKVIYFDLLEGEINPVRQKYFCLSETEYIYQNVPNDFEAKIVVDEYGLVVDYPQLFTRTDVRRWTN